MRLYFLLVVIIISSTCFAQQDEKVEKTAVVFLKGGVHMSTISSPNFTEDFKLGIQTGFVSDFYLTNKLGMQLEILYSTQGYSFPGGKIRMTYLNLPVLLNYEISRVLTLEAGPQFGWNVGHKGILDWGNRTYGLLGFDLSACAGLRIDVGEQFSLQPRYSRSLNTLSDDGNYFHAVASLSLLINL